MKIERHETGPRMSKAVIHGDTVYLAGIVADSPKGRSMAEQTRSILSQIDDLLASAEPTKLSCSRPISGSPTWRTSLR
jgi:enamine deaminase RidA (YjgF/YER057c/UK114 family)